MTRDYLAKNGLIGKIRLLSDMSEKEILREIRSVFREPMRNNRYFLFSILQLTGGASKSLTIPAVSPSFQWTASGVAGKNAKAPIYIIAREELKVLLTNRQQNNCTIKDLPQGPSSSGS